MKNNKNSITEVKKILWYVAIFVLSLVSIYFLCDGDRKMYSVPKDVGFYKGVFFFLILLFVLRKISIKAYAVWAFLFVGLVIVFLYLRINNINSMTYGEDFFRVVLYIRLSIVLFVSLMVDSIKNIKKIINKANAIWFVYAVFAVCVFISHKNAFPIIIPAFALLTTYIDNKDRNHVFDLYALAYYFVFLYMLFLSLVFYKDVYSSGRFIGAFMSEGTGGSFCGGAFVVGLYFIARFCFSSKKKWYNLVISLIMLALTIYPNMIIASRSSEVGILLAVLVFFMFVIGKKNKKTVLIRISCVAAAMAVLFLFVIILSMNANKQIQAGTYNPEEHSYLYNHITVFMNPVCRSGYFGEDSILNVFDYFASERLRIWDASLKLVEPFGKKFEGVYVEWNNGGEQYTSPHSFFIWMLISYGGICGVFLFAWYIGTIVCGITRSLRSDISSVLPLLWFMFCIGPFGGLTVYWNTPVATVLCLIQYSMCFRLENDKDAIKNDRIKGNDE